MGDVDRQALLDVMRDAVKQVRGISEFEEGTPLYAYDDTVKDHLGFDSLDAVDLMYALEDAVKMDLEEDFDLLEICTVGDVLDLLERLLSEERDPGDQ